MTSSRLVDISRVRSEAPSGCVLTTGTFDGLHVGHQHILQEVERLSRSTGRAGVLLTYHPHPRSVVTGLTGPRLLTTINEKKELAARLFSGYLVVLPFTEQIRELTAEEFVRKIVVESVGASDWVIGFDHVLGKGRSGNIDTLRRIGEYFGVQLHVAEALADPSGPISSSRIRLALERGDIPAAVALLGHPYPMCGVVERGLGMGRKIGYPTANLRIAHEKQLPADGIYACVVDVESTLYDAMLYVGTNWLAPDSRKTVEAHLFDFDREIYDMTITVYPTEKTRDPVQFESTDALIRQLGADKNESMERLDKRRPVWR